MRFLVLVFYGISIFYFLICFIGIDRRANDCHRFTSRIPVAINTTYHFITIQLYSLLSIEEFRQRHPYRVSQSYFDNPTAKLDLKGCN